MHNRCEVEYCARRKDLKPTSELLLVRLRLVHGHDQQQGAGRRECPVEMDLEGCKKQHFGPFVVFYISRRSFDDRIRSPLNYFSLLATCQRTTNRQIWLRGDLWTICFSASNSSLPVQQWNSHKRHKNSVPSICVSL